MSSIVDRKAVNRRACRRVMVCVTLMLACVGLDLASDCEQTPYPTCDGECSQGLLCVADTGGGEFCICAPPCEELQGLPEECLEQGACPPRTFCWFDVETDTCVCEELPCHSSPYPACDGECPPGTICLPGPDDFCECVEADCEQSPYAICEGLCHIVDQVCRAVEGIGCVCTNPPCEASAYPTCDGGCEPWQVCVSDPTGDPICACEPRCEQTLFPTCDGACPDGTVCVPTDVDPQVCACEERLCEQSPFPTCEGSCPGGMDCVTDPSGDPNCVCRAPCQSSGAPTCNGLCPDGTVCEFVGGPICRCNESTCEQSPYPECGGSCPSDQDCVADPTGGPFCLCEQLACEQTPYPTCGGECPPGSVCAPDLTEDTLQLNFTGFGEYLISLPRVISSPSVTNAQELGAALNASGLHTVSVSRFDSSSDMWDVYNIGDAGPGFSIDPLDGLGYRVEMAPPPGSLLLTGVDSTSPIALTGPGPFSSGTHAISLPFSWPFLDAADLLEEIGPAAVYVARLDPVTGTLQIYTGTSGIAFPIVSGEGYLVQVSQDTLYEPSTMICACRQIECAQSEFPVCDGVCPPGTTCLTDPLGSQACTCEPYFCEEGPFPTCDGFCPPGTRCTVDPSGFPGCVCDTACEVTLFPECDGVCPPGDECVNRWGSDDCECVPGRPECGDALAPVCDGECPPDERCTDDGQSCGCELCGQVTPGVVSGVHWLNKIDFRWSPLPCASWYNVYRHTAPRLTDVDADGLADNYGFCFGPVHITPEADDANSPFPGLAHFYLVTGENLTGEGALGFTSAPLPRPNRSPCP